MVTRSELQLLRSLREKRHREERGLFAVEGEKIVGELLAAGHPFEKIYATPAWRGRRTDDIAEADMARASHFPTPSCVLAVGRIRRAELAPGELGRGLTLALDGVQDPGNVGTILRIADWFGLARVLLSPGCADLYSAKVIQASMGSFARVPTFVAPLAAALAGCPVPVLGCALAGGGHPRPGGPGRGRHRDRERGPRASRARSPPWSPPPSPSRGSAPPSR